MPKPDKNTDDISKINSQLSELTRLVRVILDKSLREESASQRFSTKEGGNQSVTLDQLVSSINQIAITQSEILLKIETIGRLG